MVQWNEFLSRHKNPKGSVTIGLIGKYVELQDSYKSILESFIHAGAANEVSVSVISIHSEHLTPENVASEVGHLDGLLVAPGFGERGIEGKISAVAYARTHNIPFLGICLGMQMAVIEYARNVVGLDGANSTEMDVDTPHPVIDLMEAQKTIKDKGGPCDLDLGPVQLFLTVTWVRSIQPSRFKNVIAIDTNLIMIIVLKLRQPGCGLPV